MAFVIPTLVQGTATAIGTTNPTLVDVTGAVSFSTLADGSTLDYVIQDNPADAIREWGLGTKTTVAGKPVLTRTAATVLGGSGGAGVLANFTANKQIIYAAPIGERASVRTNTSSDPSVASLGQSIFRTDTGRCRSYQGLTPIWSDEAGLQVTNVFNSHNAFGLNGAIDDISLFGSALAGSVVLAIQETFSPSVDISSKEYSGLISYVLADPSVTINGGSGGFFGAEIQVSNKSTNTQFIRNMEGMSVTANCKASGGSIGNLIGIGGLAQNLSGTVTTLEGLSFGVQSLGNTTTMIGIYTYLINVFNAVTTAYGIWIPSTVNVGGGTIGTLYGVYIGDQTTALATTTYNVYSQGTTALNYYEGRISAAHFEGNTAAPAVAPGTGAGANGTTTLAGTDASGTITVNTVNTDTPAANATIATVTFHRAYATAPVILFMPANDAAWNLTYGIVRLRQADVSTTIFTIRSGATPLPATTTATYLFNYMIIK